MKYFISLRHDTKVSFTNVQKGDCNTNINKLNYTKMTLTGYYEGLPTATAPKTEFVKKIAEKCNVNEATVRLWVKGKTKPDNPDHVEILSIETGIEKEELFQ